MMAVRASVHGVRNCSGALKLCLVIEYVDNVRGDGLLFCPEF